MGAIEDTRKVLQDFVAPELRAILVRLDALEKRFDIVDRKFEKVDQKLAASDLRLNGLDLKLNDMDHRAERRHDQLMSELRRVAQYNDIVERLNRLESKDSPHQ